MTLSILPFNNLQAYHHPLTLPNMFLSLLAYIIHNHSLDLVITSSYTYSFPTIWQSFITVPDHFPISLTSAFHKHCLHLLQNYPPLHRNMNIVKCNNYVASTDLILQYTTSFIVTWIDWQLRVYTTLNSRQVCTFNYHNLKPHKPSPWYTSALLALKSTCSLLSRTSIQLYQFCLRLLNSTDSDKPTS